MDVGLPLPACRVGVPCADELGLEALQFLLVAEFVGLFICCLALVEVAWTVKHTIFAMSGQLDRLMMFWIRRTGGR